MNEEDREQDMGASAEADRAAGLRPQPPTASSQSSIPSAWGLRLSEGVVDLIRRVGIYDLGGNDGCPCTHFAVRSVNVDVSCHKSGDHGIRVYTRHSDFDREDGSYRTDERLLAPIAEEVRRQVDAYYDADGEYGTTFSVRFCSYEDEHKPASAIEARSDETAKTGAAEGESAVPKADAQPSSEDQQ